jgi:peptidyl-dipeptidase Dcp
MKRLLIPSFVVLAFMFSCKNNDKKETVDMTNPLLSEWNTPFGVAPFDKIKEENFLPAFEVAMDEHNKEIAAITDNAEAPTFDNTIAALDASGETLTKISSLFFNLLSANTNEKMQNIAQEISPKLSAHGDAISMNENLFARIKTIYDQKETLKLNTEQSTLLDKTYKSFVRGGSNLSVEDKAKLTKINQDLSLLTLSFGNNVLAETNKFQLIVDNEKDLAGLPADVIQAAAELAKADGKEGKWLFTIQKPSLLPFLTYCENRDLREKIFKGYINKGDNNDSLDNKENIKKILKLRLEKANLLGFATHADYVLDEEMAKTPANVYKLLDQVWAKALPAAKKEASELQKMLVKDVKGGKLQAWDWWFYSEKLRKAKYDLDEEQLRPYFKLENVRDGMFAVANKLFGISFVRRTDVALFNPEMEAYEVKDADSSTIGLFTMDFYPRASKEAGAWMTSYRDQYIKDGKNVMPIVSLTTNFTRPTSDKPSLLTYEEVSTMFHEFGHSLHGLLSKVTYHALSGTNVPRDFVEMPSQIMENWAAEPEVLKMFARNYLTNEVIPDELIMKIQNSGHFNQGFTTVEYMAAAYLDMDYHTQKSVDVIDSMNVDAFENASMAKINLIPEIVVRYRSTYFSHIFSGGYSAGYYSYMWAAVLDADAFSAFTEKGIFDPVTAKSFRDNILSKGGTEDPMKLYVDFRGREPKVDALMTRKGF